MVKTLFKYEFKAYLRTLLPMQLILLVVAAFTRTVQFLENDHFSYDIIFGSSVTALIVSMVFLAVVTVIFGITRFYKNLFSYEGYLSFTLPVTPAQHIFTKLTTLVTFTLMTVVSIIAAIVIATSGDMLVELVKAISYALSKFSDMTHGHSTFFIIEFIFTLILSSAVTYMLYYACISIGQLARKNRVLVAFAAYFGYYLISESLQAVLVIAIMLFSETPLAEQLVLWIGDYPEATVHTGFAIFAALDVLFGFVFYKISHSIIKNKLNLE